MMPVANIDLKEIAEVLDFSPVLTEERLNWLKNYVSQFFL